MLIVGELINASRKSVKEIIENQDAAGVAKLARDQQEHGADYIDVNAGVFVGREPELLKWLVGAVQRPRRFPAASTARTRRRSPRPSPCTRGPP